MWTMLPTLEGGQWKPRLNRKKKTSRSEEEKLGPPSRRQRVRKGEGGLATSGDALGKREQTEKWGVIIGPLTDYQKGRGISGRKKLGYQQKRRNFYPTEKGERRLAFNGPESFVPSEHTSAFERGGHS